MEIVRCALVLYCAVVVGDSISPLKKCKSARLSNSTALRLLAEVQSPRTRQAVAVVEKLKKYDVHCCSSAVVRNSYFPPVVEGIKFSVV